MTSDLQDKLDNMQMSNALHKDRKKKRQKKVTVSLQGPLITKDKDDGIVYKSEGDLKSEDPELINDFANASIA